jgi:hypothetical protein
MELPTCLRLAIQSVLFTWIERPGFASSRTRLRMQVLHRDHYRCRNCGSPGDEITLQVSLVCLNGRRPEALALCAPCYRCAFGNVGKANVTSRTQIQQHSEHNVTLVVT